MFNAFPFTDADRATQTDPPPPDPSCSSVYSSVGSINQWGVGTPGSSGIPGSHSFMAGIHHTHLNGGSSTPVQVPASLAVSSIPPVVPAVGMGAAIGMGFHYPSDPDRAQIIENCRLLFPLTSPAIITRQHDTTLQALVINTQRSHFLPIDSAGVSASGLLLEFHVPLSSASTLIRGLLQKSQLLVHQRIKENSVKACAAEEALETLMSSTRLERRNFSERVRSRAGGIVLRRMWDEQLEFEKTREREELEECVRAFEEERERSKPDPGSGGLSPIAERGTANLQFASTSSPRGSSGSERSTASPREHDLLKRLATLEDELRKCQRDYKTRFQDRTRVKEIETLLMSTSLTPATSLQHTPSSVSLPETRGRNHFRATSPPPPAMPTPTDRRRLTFQQANGGGYLNINGAGNGRNGMDLMSPGAAGQPSPTLPPLNLGNQGGLFAPAVGPPLPSPGLREWARGGGSRSGSRPGSRGPGSRAPTPPVGSVAVRLKE